VDRQLTVVGCFAHPDDETWSMSGSLALLAAHGARCAVWTATRGEAGVIAGATGVPRERLGEVREAEERAALAVVGVNQVEFGDLPDGGVDAGDHDELVRAVHAFLERMEPDVVVAMEPAGITAHPDHMAVTRATETAFAAYAGTADASGRRPRLYYQGVPKSRLDRLRESELASQMDLPAEDQPFAPRGTPDEQFTCHVDVSSVVPLRAAALREHRTQLEIEVYALLSLPEEEIGMVLGFEDYIRVHPAPHPDDPDETSLVEAFLAEASGG
jgi:LmbE family N-acetylglucosaminyl deacetylase